MNCGNCETPKTENSGPKDFIAQTIADIHATFIKEGPALDWVGDHDLYVYLRHNAPFYVSDIHCREEEQTWFAVAKSKEDYDKWEENEEHQHHPQEEHEHYLGVKA